MYKVQMNELIGALKPLSLLEAVAGLQHPATLAELAVSMGVPKPTMHRWLGSREIAGLLQRTPDGRRYELARRASRLAFSILSNKPGGAVRHDILRRVVHEVGEACNLTVLDGTSVTYLDRVESTWPLRITFQQGSKVPAYCSASGKLFLALMPPAKRDPILNEMTFDRLTENTVTDKAVIDHLGHETQPQGAEQGPGHGRLHLVAHGAQAQQRGRGRRYRLDVAQQAHVGQVAVQVAVGVLGPGGRARRHAQH